MCLGLVSGLCVDMGGTDGFGVYWVFVDPELVPAQLYCTEFQRGAHSVLSPCLHLSKFSLKVWKTVFSNILYALRHSNLLHMTYSVTSTNVCVCVIMCVCFFWILCCIIIFSV